MIIIIAIAGFLLLLTGLHFILRDFSRFIWKKTASIRFPATFVDLGEYAVTAFVTLVLSVLGLLFYKFATALVAYLLSGDLISFFVLLRGVFTTESVLQNPFNIQHLTAGLMLTPALQFITFYLIYRGIRTFMFLVNRYYKATIYSESDVLYGGLISSILFILFEIIFYTQYIPTVSGVAHLTYLVVSKLSVIGYYLSVAHLQLMRNQKYKTSLPSYVHLNRYEQSIINSRFKTVLITYSIGVILYLPLFTGTQFLNNNWLLIFIYLGSCVVFYLAFRFFLSGGYNYLGVVMLVERPENLSPNQRLVAKRSAKIILITLGILSLVLAIIKPKLFLVFLFCAAVAALLLILFHLLFYFAGLLGSLLRVQVKGLQKPDIKLVAVYNYLLITAKATFKASVPMLGLILFVFVLLSFFPKEFKYSNENYLHSVYDAEGNPLFVEQKDNNGSIPVSYTDIPAFFQKCLYLQEDRGFKSQHDWMPNKSNWHGISLSTFYRFFTGGGGSNLNMQLIKNVAFRKTFPQDVQRKFAETLTAYQLSVQSPYQNIVTDYLNEVGLNGGQGHTGVIAASLYTFNLPVNSLNPLEMMYLVATLKRGSQFKTESGYINYKDAAMHSQEIKEALLNQAEKWYKDKLISKQEINSLKTADLRFVNKMDRSFCKTTTREFFANQIKTSALQGVTYKSSLSFANQKHISDAVNEFERQFADQLQVGEYDLYSAALVVNVETGEIIGHYGGEGVTELTQFSGGNPVGSLIKPFILLQLLENGFRSDAIRLYDGKVPGRYTPSNYNRVYSHKYMGLKEVLAKSPNAPMVNTRLLTPPIPLFIDVETRFNQMGIPSDTYTNLNEENRSGEFEVNYPLGSRNMQLYHIAQAYQTLMNDGYYRELSIFTSVYKPELREWQKVNNKQGQIYSAENARLIKNAMEGSLEPGGTAHQLTKILPKDGTFYAKTGTTDQGKNGYIALSDGHILIVTSVKYYNNSNGNLQDRNAPPIPGGSGGKSAGVLAAMIYNQFKSN